MPTPGYCTCCAPAGPSSTMHQFDPRRVRLVSRATAKAPARFVKPKDGSSIHKKDQTLGYQLPGTSHFVMGNDHGWYCQDKKETPLVTTVRTASPLSNLQAGVLSMTTQLKIA